MKTKFLFLTALAVALFALTACKHAEEVPNPGNSRKPAIPSNEIHYISANGEVVNPYNNAFGDGVAILSNTYENGQGIITFSAPVTTIGTNAFYDCYNLTGITIPNSVKTIGESTFYGCTSLTSISIPDGVTTIGISAFAGCRSLTSISIPDGVTTIGISAFAGCHSLTSIFIPESVTTIGISAFNSCRSLTSISIPDGVATIEGSAFYDCSSLTYVYCRPATPPSLGLIVFSTLVTTIYVPRESVEAYRTAEGWSNYADRMVGYDFYVRRRPS